ncbi:hypothetical protein Lal_00042685 [Lupinus albus]|nr:hypothetical protein Lal_00042685 [Lupinus albus]
MAGQETPTNMEGKLEMTELKEQMAEMMKMMMKMQQENTTRNFSKTSPGAKTTPPPRQGSSSKQTTKEGKGKGPPNNYQTRPYQNFNRNQPRPFQPQRTFDPIPVTYAELFAHLQTKRILAPIAGQTPNTTAPWYDPNANCDYHSGIIGHSTETCRALKHRIQDLIDSKWLEFKDTVPTITGNLYPTMGIRE